MTDTENFQRAQLTVEFPPSTIEEDKNGYLFAKGTYTIKNIGLTSANQIAIQHGGATSLHFPSCKLHGKTLVEPNPAGPPLGPSQSPITIEYDFLVGQRDAIEKRQTFTSYRIDWAFIDVFGRKNYATILFVYEPRFKRFLRCGVVENNE
jgi:hypothetical protein